MSLKKLVDDVLNDSAGITTGNAFVTSSLIGVVVLGLTTWLIVRHYRPRHGRPRGKHEADQPPTAVSRPALATACVAGWIAGAAVAALLYA